MTNEWDITAQDINRMFAHVNLQTHHLRHRLSGGQLRYIKELAKELEYWQDSTTTTYDQMHERVTYAINMIHQVYDSYTSENFTPLDLRNRDGIPVLVRHSKIGYIATYNPKHWLKHVQLLTEIEFALMELWHYNQMTGEDAHAYNTSYVRHIWQLCHYLLKEYYGDADTPLKGFKAVSFKSLTDSST